MRSLPSGLVHVCPAAAPPAGGATAHPPAAPFPVPRHERIYRDDSIRRRYEEVEVEPRRADVNELDKGWKTHNAPGALRGSAGRSRHAGIPLSLTAFGVATCARVTRRPTP